MQIDFHHTTTYVIARYAGFCHKEANIISYCSQYVDNATQSGTISFDNRAMYRRISSAHKIFDWRNFIGIANHTVWLPFHFLPGNTGETMRDKFVCKPNSDIAKDMIIKTIEDQNRSYSLHRLGIAMHVYADTWAHQNFSGINDPVNSVQELKVDGKKESNKWANFKLSFLSKRFPLGHGAAGTNPDLPYIKWEYINGRGKKIIRNNLDIFLDAADHMYSAMKAYQSSDLGLTFKSIPELQKNKLKELFLKANTTDENDRHSAWLEALAAGEFDFGSQVLSYEVKGADSIKSIALNTVCHYEILRKFFKYKYHDDFVISDWKLFHDAIQAHRFDIIHDILPKYGICAG